jgi:hypothetical protein
VLENLFSIGKIMDLVLLFLGPPTAVVALFLCAKHRPFMTAELVSTAIALLIFPSVGYFLYQSPCRDVDQLPGGPTGILVTLWVISTLPFVLRTLFLEGFRGILNGLLQATFLAIAIFIGYLPAAFVDGLRNAPNAAHWRC